MTALNILVVDDEQIVALDIRRTLERLGYTVPAIIPDGPTAVHKATELQPDLVLMDIRLKGEMDGIEAASIISGKLGIPVIYLTAYSDTVTLERAKSSNPFGFLIKPFEERELHSTIEIALLKHAAERRLDEARRKAEEENQAKSGYFADMSHEIRNSLNGIIGMTDLALDTTLTADQRDYLSTVLESAENLLSILNDILDISRIEARRLSLTEKTFDLNTLLARVMRSLRPDAERKGLRLSSHISPSVPCLLKGDPGRLQQILLNLMGNALKFTATGSIELEVNSIVSGPITASPHVERKEHLLFSVRDTGTGIPEDRLASIFERYRQVDRETAPEVTGSGLGLAICKELVELMGGSIWVRSRVDQGSTFYFTTHIAPGGDVDSAALQRMHAAANDRAAMDGRTLHVLAADDNLVSRKLVRMLLEKQGHSCVTANNGLEMLSRLEQERFDLVLTNIQMPRMGGLEAVRRIRAGLVHGVPADLPVIAITAHALKGDRERFLDAGMTDYVSKPLHTEQFYRVVNAVMQIGLTPSDAAEATPPTPLLDTDAALERLQGDTEAVRTLWMAFMVDAPERLAGIRNALRGDSPSLEATRMEQACNNAQALQHTAATIGALMLSREAEHCAQILRTGDREPAADAAARLESLLARTIITIDRTIKTLATEDVS